MLDNLILGFSTALSFENVLWCFVGVFMGTVIGVLPGLGSTTGVAVLMPLTLGLELMLRLSPLTLLKSVFRRLSVLLGGASAGVQGAIEARQEGRESARVRTDARQQLSAHARDLETLRRLYPQVKELRGQQDEIKADA